MYSKRNVDDASTGITLGFCHSVLSPFWISYESDYFRFPVLIVLPLLFRLRASRRSRANAFAVEVLGLLEARVRNATLLGTASAAARESSVSNSSLLMAFGLKREVELDALTFLPTVRTWINDPC
jgi:hypothetical protein